MIAAAYSPFLKASSPCLKVFSARAGFFSDGLVLYGNAGALFGLDQVLFGEVAVLAAGHGQVLFEVGDGGGIALELEIGHGEVVDQRLMDVASKPGIWRTRSKPLMAAV